MDSGFGQGKIQRAIGTCAIAGATNHCTTRPGDGCGHLGDGLEPHARAVWQLGGIFRAIAAARIRAETPPPYEGWPTSGTVLRFLLDTPMLFLSGLNLVLTAES